MNDTAIRRLSFAAIAGLLVAMYWNFSSIIWMKWFDETSYYSHGLLIPAVTLYLIWRMRDQLAELPVAKSNLGLLVLLAGALTRLFGAYMRVNYISGFSFVILAVGIVLYLYGRRITWKLLFPLLFLIWMVPLPDPAIIDISYELKNFAAQVAAHVLPYLGVDVFGLENLKFVELRGSELTFLRPNYVTDQVTIDDVCSGLRSMIALLAFGSLFAYITSAGPRKRLELFAASVPCSIVANMSRIVLITIVAYFGGATYATVDKIVPNPFGEAMTIHDVTGLVIFIVAFIGFFTYEKLLNQFPLKLPKAAGPRHWLYDAGGKVVKLADNQLLVLIRAGHMEADDKIRKKDEPQWRKAMSLPQYAAESPRQRLLQVEGTDKPMTFSECQQAVREGRISRTDFIHYAEGNARTLAANLDFLRLYWPLNLAQKAAYLLLYAGLPVVLFFIVRSHSFFNQFANGILGQILVTIVLWFGVRTVLLLGDLTVRHFRAPEKPMPAPVEDAA